MCAAIVHPDIHEKIPMLLCMSAFVPMGVVFVLGMRQPKSEFRIGGPVVRRVRV
jgi:hypothetical protein